MRFTNHPKLTQSANSARNGMGKTIASEIRENILHPEEKHVGVSWLRRQNAAALWQLQQVIIFHSHAEPLAVLIPYETFMLLQARISEGAGLLEKLTTGVSDARDRESV